MCCYNNITPTVIATHIDSIDELAAASYSTASIIYINSPIGLQLY